MGKIWSCIEKYSRKWLGVNDLTHTSLHGEVGHSYEPGAPGRPQQRKPSLTFDFVGPAKSGIKLSLSLRFAA